MKISEPKSNNKTPQNPFNFDSIKNSFWLHVLNGILNLKAAPTIKKKKSHRVVFEKISLYFTSHMNISKSKSNNKTPPKLFNFDSIKNSFWVHIDTGH